ncbi:MAG: SEC-C metal-binding domain-containing protein, partial [Pseudomonadota bacterium]
IQDDLMRIFGSDRMDGMLRKLGLEEDEAIIHPWINKALERAQEKVEARNFDMRKNLLKFDDVMNDQRKAIFDQRIDLMKGDESITDTIADMREEVIEDIVSEHIPENAYAEQWDIDGLKTAAQTFLNRELPIAEWADEDGIAEQEMTERLVAEGQKLQAEKLEMFGPETWEQVQKSVMLQTLDHLWREHLENLDNLRSVVGLRGYAQRDPLNEYKSESFELFQAMLTQLRRAVTTQLSLATLVQAPAEPEAPDFGEMEQTGFDALPDEGGVSASAATATMATIAATAVAPEDRDPEDPTTWGKVGRNEACPCGSGKKYKHCHGMFA